MRHHTKEKGDFGVLKAQLDLYQKGFVVSIPLTEHAPFDLIATKDGVSKTIQVKYRSLKNEKLDVSLRTSWADKRGTHIKHIDKTQIDIYCIYCPELDECFYVNLSDFEEYTSSITLRRNPPKNNQKVNVHLLEDYREVP